MDFKFKDIKVSLIPKSTQETHGIITTYIHKGFDIKPFKQVKGSQKDSALLAFKIVAQIANEALGEDCKPSDFTTPQGGHMVILGDYNSWGADSEASKNRVKHNFSEVSSVEFYIRHALLALEHKTNKIKLKSEQRCICG